MAHTLEKSLAFIAKNKLEKHFLSLQRGIEKESLRVDQDGLLAQTPHPQALGSPLTHESITTDYSEALLEFVTPIHTDIGSLLTELTDIHHYTYQVLGNEKLWVNSMPCIVEGERKIPIARYGSSNVAKMKEAYRRGLGHRYGRLMQTIAGIHFNFSLPDSFWDDYLETRGSADRQTQKSSHYFSLTRNFLRHSWLPCYLFGASPAVCKSFLRGREHNLQDFKERSFYAPHATSLRLSGLGYSNKVQDQITVCYNSVEEYVTTLRKAINTPYPDYQKIPAVVDGNYQQLNPNMLQIENEFYAAIRPKQVAQSGESPARALSNRGVEYVEIRSLDLNPFNPVGIDESCIRFFDTFLLYCLFSDNQPISETERNQAADNRHRIVMTGRQRGTYLLLNDKEIPFTTAALDILQQMEPIAAMLDEVNGGTGYRESIDAQVARINHPELTESAKIIDLMEREFDTFFYFAMHQAESHEHYFKSRTMAADTRRHYERAASLSIEKQRQVESDDNMDFPAFLEDYFRRQNAD